MSFNQEELEAHCDEIVNEPAIQNRIVVLCEGGKPLKPSATAPSITEFAQTTQDSAFYYRAVPSWWRTTGKLEPYFYPCGTQTNVISAYFYLKEKHQASQPKESYLKHNNLFALLDIDLQKTKISGEYLFKNVEDIYQNLYKNGKVNTTSKDHSIWVTGLLHKEAYFLIPELHDLLSNHQPKAVFDNFPVALTRLYQKIVQSMTEHTDINKNFPKAKKRIQHHQLLYHSQSVNDFQKIWLDGFTNSKATTTEKNALIYALLTIAKSKPIWEDIKLPIETADHKNYRDELCLKIGREFYAKQPRESEHHLPSFFNMLSTINA